MVSFLEAVGDAARGAFCTVLADFAALEANVNNALGIGSPAAGPAAGAYSWVCDRPRPERPGPPFTGGQCPALYDVVINRVSTTRVGGPGGNETNYNQDFYGTYQGPISGVVDKASYPAQSSQVYVRHNGTETFKATGSVGGGVEIIRATVSIKSVTRVNGQPDNCGDPPAIITPPPPGYNNHPTNITYNDNEGNEFSFPVVVVVGYASVNLNGELTIPMKFNFDINPDFNFEINFNINTGKPELVAPKPGKPNPGKPTDPLDPLPRPDPTKPPFPDPENPDEEPEEEEPKTKQLLRGVIVTSTAPPASLSTVYQEGNPDLVLPDMGQVQFQIQVGTILSWTGHTKVQSRRHFIPCPWEFGAVGVRGTPRPGVTWQLTPVYIEQTYAEKYPPDFVVEP